MKHLTASNITELESNGNVTISADAGLDHNVSASIRRQGARYVVSARLYSKKPQKAVGNRKQMTVNSIREIDVVIEILGRVLVVENTTDNGKPGQNRRVSLKDFTERVLSVEELWDPLTWGVRRNGRYLSKSTIETAVNYFANTIGNMYAENKTFEVNEAEQRSFKNREIDRIYEQQNKNNNNPPTRDKIANDLNGRWKYAEEVRQLLCSYADDRGPWPKTPLLVDVSVKTSSPELAKVFPYKRYVQAVVVIVRACEEKIPEAFGGAGEALNACRVGESTALQMGLFRFKGEKIGRYYIDFQVDSKGEITNVLKNEYSHRFISLCDLMQKLYKLKYSQLKEAGLNDEEIRKAYFGCSMQDPFHPIRKQRVSQFLKELLIFVGCDRDELAELEVLVAGNTGNDSDNDLSAHIFRRFLATMWANGGIDTYRVDAELGHENQANKNKDYAGWDNAEDMIRMKDRCIFLGKLCSSFNAAYEPAELKNGTYVLDGNRGYQFVATEDGLFEVNVETIEADDAMRICMPGIEEERPEIIVKADENVDRQNRIVLSRLPSRETINEWIDEAYQMDLDSFLNKYRRREQNG